MHFLFENSAVPINGSQKVNSKRFFPLTFPFTKKRQNAFCHRFEFHGLFGQEFVFNMKL